MRKIEESSIDLVLTDPPYNVDLNYNQYDDKMEEEKYWNWMEKVFHEAERIIKDSGAIAIVTPGNQRRKWTKLIDNLELEEVGGSPVVWCRNNCVGGGGGFGHSFDYATYFIYVLVGEEFEINNGPPADAEVTSFNWIVEPAPQSNFEEEERTHPAQQPERVYEKILLKCSHESDSVLDPFMGSGTTGVVCKRWDRYFVGVDVSGDYVKKARERISKTTKNAKQLKL